MSASSLSALLGAAVRVGTVRVGDVVGVFVDRDGRRAIGLEVSTAGGIRRFVPWVAARYVDGAVSLDSALVIMDDSASYERLGARSLRDTESLGGLQAAADGRIGEGAVSTGALMGTQRR